jgi:hypothetical protein
MIDCITAELYHQDDRLNENYKKLMSTLSKARKNRLLEAQRTWLRFRDANCRLYYDPEGGSAARVEARECQLNATTDRADELELLTHTNWDGLPALFSTPQSLPPAATRVPSLDTETLVNATSFWKKCDISKPVRRDRNHQSKSRKSSCPPRGRCVSRSCRANATEPSSRAF